jgi:hypothetical protein
MRSPFEAAKTNIQKLETPSLIQQVETHLIFGPLARHLPIAYLAIVVGVITLIWSLSRTVPVGQHIGEILEIIIVQIIIFPVILFNMTRRRQALVTWLGVKFGLGFAAFMMLMIGGFGGLAQGHRDALPALFLGLI